VNVNGILVLFLIGASNIYNTHANHDTKITAISHASFSPPAILFELIIINIGNSQINPIKAKFFERLDPNLA